MPRRPRADGAPPISLFAFQDIMAAVTGVMILVTLLLALEPLADEMLQPSQQETPPEPTMAIETAQAMVTLLKEELERRRADPVIDERLLEELATQLEGLKAVDAEASFRLRRVELAKQVALSEQASAEEDAVRAEETLVSARERLRRERLRSRVRFLPGERFEKAPLFIEILHDSLTLGAFGADGMLTRIGQARGVDSRTAQELLRNHSQDAYQLVLVVRQDALEPFVQLRDALHERGWSLGWQLWDQAEGEFLELTEPEP